MPGVLPDGPSPRLETAVGVFIPPSCREEVLGDLREKYASRGQYVLLAISVIPLVILSRIRRTSDLRIRLTEALIIYGSFLAAAWYREPSVLSTRQGLLRVAIPTVVNLIDLVFEDLWAGGSKWPSRIVRSVAFGIGIGFNVYGEFASVLLVLGLRMLIGRGMSLPREASGPDLRSTRRTVAIALQGAGKSLLMAAGAVTVTALFLELAGHPAGKATMAAIVVFVVVVVFRKPPKEQ